LNAKADRISGIVSEDGQTVTDYAGNTLGPVVRSVPVKLATRSVIHGANMRAIRVRLDDGTEWHGRGSPGAAILLRKASAPARDRKPPKGKPHGDAM